MIRSKCLILSLAFLSSSAFSQSNSYIVPYYCEGYTDDSAGVTAHYTTIFEADYRNSRQMEALYTAYLSRTIGKRAYDISCTSHEDRSEAKSDREARMSYQKNSGIAVKMSGWTP